MLPKFSPALLLVVAQLLSGLNACISFTTTGWVFPPRPCSPCSYRHPLITRFSVASSGHADDDVSPFVGNVGPFVYHRMDLLSDQTLNPKSSKKVLHDWLKTTPSLKDLIVVSHGWNTPPDKAWGNYQDLFTETHMDALMEEHGLKPGDFGVIGITWNSYAREDLIKQIEEYIQEFEGDIDTKALEEIKDKVTELVKLNGDPSAIFDPPENEPSYRSPFSDDQESIDKLLADLRTSIAQLILNDEESYDFDYLLEDSDVEEEEEKEEEEDDDFDFQGQVFRGADWPNPFNFHFHMKRAVRLGREPVSSTLQELSKTHGLRVHLVGHSFGALLLSAATHKDGRPGDYASMTLAQGAYSHNAFAKNVRAKRPGMFRDIVEKEIVSGPVAVTHTKNDFALARLYPAAARFLGIHGSKLPGIQMVATMRKPGRFGAIGSNGALGLDEVINGDLSKYDLSPDKLNNLKADDEISDHNDVWTQHVARLVVRAAKSSQNEG